MSISLSRIYNYCNVKIYLKFNWQVIVKKTNKQTNKQKQNKNQIKTKQTKIHLKFTCPEILRLDMK